MPYPPLSVAGIPPHAARRDLACTPEQAEDFFPRFTQNIAAVEKAKRVCGGCPARLDCLAWAVMRREPHGVWGGTTRRERTLLAQQWAKTGIPREVGGTVVEHRPPGRRGGYLERRDPAQYFAAAREFLGAGAVSHADTARRNGVSRTRMSMAVAVLRYAPDLEARVLAGDLGLTPAHRQAQARRVAS